LRFSRDWIITPTPGAWCISRSQVLNTFAIDLWPSRNCPISGAAEARSSPPARKGRSEAEWLDGAEDRRTISRRDGHSLATAMLSARTNATNETRGLEDRQEVDGAMPSQEWIRCECAFTYMNAVFRRNLTDALSVDANGRGHRVRYRLRTRRWHGQYAVLPDDSDIHLGRERPPKTSPGTVIGGWQRGSLTPQMRCHCCRQLRRLRHGRQTAPPD
jgi:hypothetical protein